MKKLYIYADFDWLKEIELIGAGVWITPFDGKRMDIVSCIYEPHSEWASKPAYHRHLICIPIAEIVGFIDFRQSLRLNWNDLFSEPYIRNSNKWNWQIKDCGGLKA